mmetsp:Transcript_18510/g.42699  ORF Transcript_18510/g.42699 Transcript_18510/m.42699 type:complete len:106 (+) Transcript_18510:418-735(+)
MSLAFPPRVSSPPRFDRDLRVRRSESDRVSSIRLRSGTRKAPDGWFAKKKRGEPAAADLGEAVTPPIRASFRAPAGGVGGATATIEALGKPPREPGRSVGRSVVT